MNRFFVSAVLFSLVSSSAFATKFSPKDLSFDDAHITPTKKGTSVQAGYVRITNTGGVDVDLKVVAASPFKGVEMHETVEENGMSTMRRMKSVTISPRETVEFKPGGMHLMFFDPKTPVSDEQIIPVQFIGNGKKFARPFKIVSAEPAAAASPEPSTSPTPAAKEESK